MHKFALNGGHFVRVVVVAVIRAVVAAVTAAAVILCLPCLHLSCASSACLFTW